MRGVFSLLSLMLIVGGIAYYYTSLSPIAPGDGETQGAGGYQALKNKAENAAAQMQDHSQAQVDAATTNAAPGN